MKFVEKTWKRKNKRRVEKRSKDRLKRKQKLEADAFELQKIQQTLEQEISEKIDKPKQEKLDFKIPNFHFVLSSELPCSHM